MTVPIVVDGQVLRMNEFAATYLVMFFLGSLVRYRADYLDGLLGSRALWLLESFVNSVPLVFLRMATSRIMNRTYVLNK